MPFYHFYSSILGERKILIENPGYSFHFVEERATGDSFLSSIQFVKN